LDAAKSLLGLLGGGNGAIHSYGCPERKFCFGCRICSGGYFVPSVIAYAVGLLMANMAVYLMNMGQPALLYLVPCCVGTMGFMAWRRNELNSLWEGPKAIRTADAMLYGEYEQPTPSNQHAPVPLEEGQAAPAVPCAEDGMPSSELNGSRNII
jgi:signal peptide peptidase-like protein 2B